MRKSRNGTLFHVINRTSREWQESIVGRCLYSMGLISKPMAEGILHNFTEIDPRKNGERCSLAMRANFPPTYHPGDTRMTGRYVIDPQWSFRRARWATSTTQRAKPTDLSRTNRPKNPATQCGRSHQGEVRDHPGACSSELSCRHPASRHSLEEGFWHQDRRIQSDSCTSPQPPWHRYTLQDWTQRSTFVTVAQQQRPTMDRRGHRQSDSRQCVQTISDNIHWFTILYLPSSLLWRLTVRVKTWDTNEPHQMEKPWPTGRLHLT